MCGIAGALGPESGRVIGPMTQSLVHRGPDGEGYHKAPGVALGHRRLSIIDIEGGAQPIPNEKADIFLICNGEIYNSPELRRDLIDRGHRFRTNTDVEVIVHLYEEYGDECVSHLRGMFAFAIWDSAQRRLLLARDHLGQKPLFFAETGGHLLFASEPKAILASGLVTPEVDLEGLWHYISLRYMTDQHSLFEGVRKLPAGHIATWQGGDVSVNQYYRPRFDSKLTSPVEQIVDGLDALMIETVRDHLLSDVRVGAFLSGGIDSSTIAAIMAQQVDDPIPSFSIGVEEQGFNELPYARDVAERYRMEAHEKIVKADLVRLMPQLVYHMDEPSDPFAIGVYLVSRLAAEHVKVVLSGDGGDENFAGYDRYVGQRLVDTYCLLPKWMRRHVMSRLVRMIPESFGYKSFALKAAWLNDMSFYTAGDRYARSMSFLRFTHEAKLELFSENAKASISSPDSSEKILDHFDADDVDHLVDKMLYTDLMTRMPDHLLAIGDRMSMAHSLETRAPLMDYKIVEYAASIPGQLKLKRNDLKHVLKKVARRHVPDSVIDRKKQGFTFPLGIWMRTELQPFVRALFSESRFIDHGIFEAGYVQRVIDEHMSGAVDHNYRLWILMNLEFWYRIHIEGESVGEMQQMTERLLAA